MKHSLIRAGLALSVALASGTAWAALPSPAKHARASAISGEVVAQRKDVDEVSRPQPANGPQTPSPTCNPAAPDC